MDALVVLLVVAVVLVVAAAAIYLTQQKKRSEHLREQFGSEYERTVSDAGRARGERELKQREERVEKLELRDLTNEERESYARRWKDVQADFVDKPETAITEADSLVQEVMAARGYPVGDFDQRTADLSVQHAGVLDHYREGHAISEAHRRSPRSTEELRQAMIHYRALYSELLGEVPSRP